MEPTPAFVRTSWDCASWPSRIKVAKYMITDIGVARSKSANNLRKCRSPDVLLGELEDL